jgi:two-component system, NarL family, nitrate/nitrite response regulator NarL
MIAVALHSADPAVRQRLAALLDGRAEIACIGVADSPTALSRLLSAKRTDVVVLDAAARLVGGHGAAGRAALVVLIGDGSDEAALDALLGGAVAVLPRSADGAAIVAAITAAAHGFAVLPLALLRHLLDARDGEPAVPSEDDGVLLTPREIEVLAALADGASNKAIARRLGISFHTVKFHVASILEKLDADSRTEAVAQAARFGLVML